MSNKIVDKVFGEMEYKHSWEKKDSLLFLDKAYPIKIVAQAYKGDAILESQQNSYLEYKKFLEKHNKEIKEKLLNYCKEICNSEIALQDCLTPTAVIFERDGSWGILFESNCDIENGVALFVVDREIKVGSQDLFL